MGLLSIFIIRIHSETSTSVYMKSCN